MEKRRHGDPENLNFEDVREQGSHKAIQTVWGVIYGHPRPEDGLMWKVSELMLFKANIDKAINKIVWCALIGSASAFGLFVWTVLRDQILRGNFK